MASIAYTKSRQSIKPEAKMSEGITLQEILEKKKSENAEGISSDGGKNVEVIICSVKQLWDIVNKTIEKISSEIPSVPSFTVSIKLQDTTVTAKYNRDYLHQTIINYDGKTKVIHHSSQKPDLIGLYSYFAVVDGKEEYQETIQEDENAGSIVFTLASTR